jgi:hypothetical protein
VASPPDGFHRSRQEGEVAGGGMVAKRQLRHFDLAGKALIGLTVIDLSSDAA